MSRHSTIIGAVPCVCCKPATGSSYVPIFGTPTMTRDVGEPVSMGVEFVSIGVITVKFRG